MEISCCKLILSYLNLESIMKRIINRGLSPTVAGIARSRVQDYGSLRDEAMNKASELVQLINQELQEEKQKNSELVRQLKAEKELLQQYKSYKEELEQVRNDRQALREEISHLKIKLEARQAHQAREANNTKELKARVENLEQELRTNGVALQALKIQYSSLQNENQYLIKQYKLKSEKLESEKIHVQPSQQVSSVKKQIENLKRAKQSLALRVGELTRQNMRLQSQVQRNIEQDFRATKKYGIITNLTPLVGENVLLTLLCEKLRLTEDRNQECSIQIQRLILLVIKHLEYFVHFTNRLAAKMLLRQLSSQWSGIKSVTEAVELSEQVLRQLRIY